MEQEKKVIVKKKKKKKLILIFIIIGLVIFLSVFIPLCLTIFQFNKNHSHAQITIEPCIVKAGVKEHLQDVSVFEFDKEQESEAKYLTKMELAFEQNQYFEYDCVIKNDGETNLYFSFEMQCLESENIKIFYGFDGFEETLLTESVSNIIEKGTVQKFYINIRVVDYEQDAKLRANLIVVVQDGEVAK